MTLRIVQWNTGIVGTSAVRAMLRHPGLEIVGCFAYAEEKRGQDVGTLCGMEPMGVLRLVFFRCSPQRSLDWARYHAPTVHTDPNGALDDVAAFG